MHNLSVQPDLMFDTVITGKKVFPYIQSEPVLFPCVLVVFCPAMHRCEEPGFVLIDVPMGRLLLGQKDTCQTVIICASENK